MSTKKLEQKLSQLSLNNYYDKQNILLKASWINTPLGQMIVIADEAAIYLLEFIDRRDLDWEIARLKSRMKAGITSGITDPIKSIVSELKSYFSGSLQKFQTPINFLGTSFQKLVWSELIRIPYGETRSYSTQAISIGKQTAYRAVANANGSNQIAIVVPCHRIINSNGNIGGYGGGITRKKWLLNFEEQHKL